MEVLELLNDHRGPMMGGAGNVGGHSLYGGGLGDGGGSHNMVNSGMGGHFPTPGASLVGPHYGAGGPTPHPSHGAPMHNYPHSNGWTRPLSRGENQPTWSSSADRPDPPSSPRRHNRPAAW